MRKNKTIYLTPLGLVGITILTGVFLISSNSFATDNTDVVDEINITVPISCSLEGTGMTSHNANIVNGTYQADIGSTTLKVFCNDDEGFAIYAIGYTDSEYGKTVLTSSTLGTSADIATGTATSGNTSNWAMKLTAPTYPTPTYPLTLDNSFGNYHAVPAEYTKVAHRDSATDIGTNAEGSTLTTTYAAFMSQTQPAGTYIGQVRYTLVHPANETPAQPVACPGGRICYNPNTNIVEGQMGQQTKISGTSDIFITNESNVELWAPNFKRDGYGFAGWNDAFDYSGNYYGPNETIVAPSNIQTNGLSLYAVWIKSAGTLQNWDGCNSLVQGTTIALTDDRDGNTYAVAKLADNKCWTIENLRLDDSAGLSSINTHNPSLPLTNVYNDTNPTTSNHLSATTDPTTTAWCTSNSSACNDQSMLATNNTTLFTNNATLEYNASSNVYSYGNYYNWYSATAGHGTNYKTSGDTDGDICPIGWHLPTSGNVSGDFSVLNIAIGGTGASQFNKEVSNKLRAYPNNFIFSGSVSGSVINNRSTYGQYWSSTPRFSNVVYILALQNSYINPGVGDSGRYKDEGFTVRCIFGT